MESMEQDSSRAGETKTRILMLVVVLFAVATTGAQIKFMPLVPLPNDLDARVNYSVPDRSSGRAGDLCAIIKVVHSDMNFSFDIGSMVVNRTVPHPELGELWVYVPVGTNRIKISHAKYGSLDTQDGFYWFEGGLKCQSGQVYRLRLETGFIAEDEDIITDDTKVQKVRFQVTPANAIIHLRKLPFDTDADGTFQMTLPIGLFHYRISAEDYYDGDGVVETVPDAETQTIEVALQHRQGLLDVQVNQSGATVKVDGQAVGTTPLELPVELNTGEHQVEVSYRNYRTESRSVMVKDGQTASVSLNLIDSTMITIDAVPSDSTLFIKNEKRGVTPNVGEIVEHSGTVGQSVQNADESGFMTSPIEFANNDRGANDKSIKTYKVGGVTFTMKLVEAGTFKMGSSDYYERPIHTVTISRDYYMGETEVTQALWYVVMGYNPVAGGLYVGTPKGSGYDNPVCSVSYNDVLSFITKLNSMTGANFRLPTEAEWEFAARGGNKSKGYTYSGSNTIDDVAWYEDNSEEMIHPVKTKQANELGLYDMSGNVDELCFDWMGAYSSDTQTDPSGPEQPEEARRVCRGGGWRSGARECRPSSRGDINPATKVNSVGFRLALSE